jgi:1-acyl-sn-glycerol-3-phosphate acyltransferase
LQFTGDHKDKEALAAFSQQVMDKIAALKAEYQI